MANGAHDKGVELISSAHPNLPTLVKGDPTRLRQVLSNLVSNAIKFTEKGHVVLYTLPIDDGIMFGVVDTGIGMNEEQQQAVLKPFTQADSSHTRKYGGTGLGLTISGRLVAAMGGELRLASAPKFGSDFSFVLPLQAVNEKLLNEHNSMLLPQQHILVVDDNETNQEVVKHLLESWGLANIGLASDGIDALQQLRQAANTEQAYDMAILDMQMPGMTGLELARAIRGEPALREIHLTMLSSLDRHEPAPELNAWLTKPMRQSELYNSLLIMLGEDSAVQQYRSPSESGEAWWFGGVQLLLVEDNLINQEVAKEILEDVGFAVAICNNGKEAVQAVQDKTYDLVLMDIQMPVMDGIEATKQIRAMGGHFTKLPIIAMTAHALTGDSDKSLAAGMNDHITKPIDPKVLFPTLSQWVNSEQQPGPSANKISEDSNEEIITDLPGIDVQEGLQRMRGKWSSYKRILLGFRSKQANACAAIEEEINSGQWLEATHLAHTLKGISGNISANALYEAAAAMEQTCKAANENEARALLDYLSEKLDEVINGLAVLEQQQPSSQVSHW